MNSPTCSRISCEGDFTLAQSRICALLPLQQCTEVLSGMQLAKLVQCYIIALQNKTCCYFFLAGGFVVGRRVQSSQMPLISVCCPCTSK